MSRSPVCLPNGENCFKYMKDKEKKSEPLAFCTAEGKCFDERDADVNAREPLARPSAQRRELLRIQEEGWAV